jgi:hypothetical protein
VSDRRFTDKPMLDPSAVYGLPAGHPAMVENRTLFPTTVVTVSATTPDRILVSGVNNRKIGRTVEKGAFAGYGIYGLSLEERATCPTDCNARAFCYGNGMQMARRHRIGNQEIFYARLEEEIKALLQNESGLLIRLHVLGDFPSVEYVAFWLDILSEYSNVACYGYTHRTPVGPRKCEIGEAVENVKRQFEDRFRIRWSSERPFEDNAIILDKVPAARSEDFIVCPSQMDATACCATCALCWESRKPIAFIKHGRHSVEQAAANAMAAFGLKRQENRLPEARQPAEPQRPVSTRPIAGIKLPSHPTPREVSMTPPEVRLIYPTELRVEPSYQRDLSGKAVALIRKIAAEWDWAKFKPPVCAETADGLFVIDGQHTAIAAASHPKSFKIPVMIVSADLVEKRADSFVSHNRDRINMTPFQILHAEAVAGGSEAKTLLEVAAQMGASIPRQAPRKSDAKPGEIVCVSEMRTILRVHGPGDLARIIRIAVLASCAPVTTTIARSLRSIVAAPPFRATAALPDKKIADALHSLDNFEQLCEREAAQTGRSKYSVGALLIARAASGIPGIGAAA